MKTILLSACLAALATSKVVNAEPVITEEKNGNG